MSQNLLNLLFSSGYISDTDVALLERFIIRWEISPFRAILRTHIMTEQDLAQALAQILDIKCLDRLKAEDISPNAYQKISFREAMEWEVMPLGCHGRAPFRVLMVDPTDESVKKALERNLSEEVCYLVAPRKIVLRAIDENYPVEFQMPHLSGQI